VIVTAPPRARNNKLLIGVFIAGFVLVLIGSIVGGDETSQLESCVSNCELEYANSYNSALYSYCVNQCDNQYLSGLYAGWVLFVVGLIVCCVDACLACAYGCST